MVTGTLKHGAVVSPINGKLNGDQIILHRRRGTQYTGQVNGNSMEGSAKRRQVERDAIRTMTRIIWNRPRVGVSYSKHLSYKFFAAPPVHPVQLL